MATSCTLEVHLGGTYYDKDRQGGVTFEYPSEDKTDDEVDK